MTWFSRDKEMHCWDDGTPWINLRNSIVSWRRERCNLAVSTREKLC